MTKTTIKTSESGKIHAQRFPWMTLCGRTIDDDHIVSNAPVNCGVCQKLSARKRIDKVVNGYGVTVSWGWSDGRCVDVSVYEQKSAVVSISLVNGFEECETLADTIAKNMGQDASYTLHLVYSGSSIGICPLDRLPESGTLFVLINADSKQVSVFRSGIYEIINVNTRELAVEVTEVNQVVALEIKPEVTP